MTGTVWHTIKSAGHQVCPEHMQQHQTPSSAVLKGKYYADSGLCKHACMASCLVCSMQAGHTHAGLDAAAARSAGGEDT